MDSDVSTSLPKASNPLVKILRRLHKEKNDLKRQELVDLGRRALLKWFSMGARNMINGSIPMTKPTLSYVKRNFENLNKLADRHSSAEEKREIILKRGGAGFLGGVIIRNMLQWPQRESQRQKYYTVKRQKKKGGYKEKSPIRKRRAPKKKSPARKKKSPARKKVKAKAQKKAKAKSPSPQPSTSTFRPPSTSTPLTDAATTALRAVERQIGLAPHLKAMLPPETPRPGTWYDPVRKNIKYTARKRIGDQQGPWKPVKRT